MARQRIIKPTFIQDERIAELSVPARYFYIALWMFMDRQGVAEGNLHTLKRNVFPADDMPLGQVQELLAELVLLRRLIPFEAEGREYLWCPTLDQHQWFHPRELVRFPAPPEELVQSFREELAKAHGSALGQPMVSVMYSSSSSLKENTLGEPLARPMARPRARTQHAPLGDPHPQLLDDDVVAYLLKVKRALQDAWVTTYGAEWVKAELKKVHLWVLANPARAPKSNWARFLNSWFERGWEKHRKTISSNSGTTFGSINTKPLRLEDL